MLRSIDCIDPNRMTTVKDLYCLYRVGPPRLELFSRHRKLLSRLGINPDEFYNRQLLDLSEVELKLVAMMSINRLAIFGRLFSNGKVRMEAINLFDILRVYECFASTLFGRKFNDVKIDFVEAGADRKVREFTMGYSFLLRDLYRNNYVDKLKDLVLFCPPESYNSECFYPHKGEDDHYTYFKEGKDIIGLEPLRFKSTRSGTHVRSRPFRENSLYPLMDETKCQFRLRDIMFGLDQNTCNGWLKRTTKKYKYTKMSEVELMNFLHKPVHNLDEKDIEIAKGILSLSEIDKRSLKYLEDSLIKLEFCKKNNFNFDLINGDNYSWRTINSPTLEYWRQ